MNIYQSFSTITEIPEEFHAVSLTLDAGLTSRLEWKAQIMQAHEWKEKGKKLFWLFDFGLRPDVSYSDTHLESLRLSVEHFDREVWNRFQQETVGACLYCGTSDLSEDQIRFFEQLAGSLPDEVEPFLMLDVTSLSSSVDIARALSKERFPHFTLAVKGMEIPVPEFGWETVVGMRGMIGERLLYSTIEDPTVGVCVPEQGASDCIDEIVQWMKKEGLSFRMIPEALLTTEWQGLDHVIVDTSSVDVLGKRRLMGFCAAGGTIVSIGELLGLPFEMSFEEWKSSGQ